MENCKHLSHIKKWNHSILNPQKWLCYECGTTESVWACLSCPSVACGRFNEEHALKHYKESQHPLCIEVNEKYVYCYKCDDYVLNDNAAGDLKILRSALSAIVTQSFKDVESRGRRLLRSYSHTAIVSPSKSDEDDRMATADFHWRQSILGKLFAAWRMYVQKIKIKQQEQTPDKKHTAMTPSSSSPFIKRRTLIPGLTGLRNLGNTCYMNSVLQILSHLEDFRDFFMKSIDPKPSQLTTPESSPKASVLGTCTSRLSSVISSIMSLKSSPSSSKTSSSLSENSPTTASTRYLSRQDTTECFKHLMTPTKDPSSSRRRHHSGLSGGSMSGTPVKRSLICNVEERDSPSYKVSLCEELNGLFRVLWSGRWAQVSPHAFLQAVWYSIPMFKGHAQHDAQEFLSELLDKVQSELATINGSLPNAENIITETFQGQLVSQVTCLECMKISETREAFMDLSLEFPNRYQITLNHSKVSQEACHVTEMLHTFTEIEKLEGKIYSCEHCNANRENRKSPIKPKYTEAQKQFIVKSLPRVLRLHLKRFRWSGRLHREKINTPVVFDDVLDMKPFCDQTEQNDDQYKYNLQGVVIHHGRGFGSGHYTAYCWNSVAESWIECNDSKIKLCSLEDVLQSQGYILVYTRSRDSDNLATPLSYTEDSSDGSDTEVPKLKTLSSQIIDDEITFNFKTPTRSDVAHGNRKRTSSGSENGDKRIIKRRRSTLW